MSAVCDLLTEFAKLDLGSKPEAYSSGCSPCDVPRRRYFPTVYISDQEKPIDLPDEGKAVIEYKVRGRSMNERDGKKRHSADIEIHTIEPGKSPSRTGSRKLLGTAKLIPNAFEDLREVVGFGREEIVAGLRRKGIAESAAGRLAARLAPKTKKVHGVVVETLGGPRLMRASKPRQMPRQFARGDVILRNLDKLPKKIGASVTKNYDVMGPVLRRALPEFKVAQKKRWTLGTKDSLAVHRDALARQLRKGRSAARTAAAAQADIARAKNKIGFRALLSDIIEFDSRPRNNNGQFVGSETGGADPDSMHAAYGPGTIAKAAVGGAAVGAGAALGLQANKARRALSALSKRV